MSFTKRSYSTLGLTLGVLAAIALFVWAVVVASSDGTASLVGLDLVKVTKTRDASGTSASLNPQPGALLLLVLPALGFAIGRSVRRSRPVASTDHP